MQAPFMRSDEDDDLPQEAKDALLAAIAQERPVTIGVIGVSGVGKSSIINRLFRTDFATSATVACTKKFTTERVDLAAKRGPATGAMIRLRVVDAPGLGESREKDPEYLEMYIEHLSSCDSILWVSAARNRAVALEQEYLDALREFHPKMVFGLSQADLVEPDNWSERINLPSEEQERNLTEICADRASKFASVVKSGVEFVPFSARRSYNLQTLFTSMVGHADRERGWLLSSIKGFEVDDWMPDEVRSTLSAEIAQRDVGNSAAPPSATGVISRLFGRSGR